MSYKYEEQRASLFTESGVKALMKVTDNVQRQLKQAGAVRAAEAWTDVGGDSWRLIAVLDYLVETHVIREVTVPGSVVAQHRIFTSFR